MDMAGIFAKPTPKGNGTPGGASSHPFHIQQNDSRISQRDMFFLLWKCRDFELQHLWQRSVFLTAFLTICFAGYGGLVASVVSREHPLGHNASWLVNGAAFSLCIVGMILSLLWILMAKGSKAWYERYENAIEAFALGFPEAFSGNMETLCGFHWEHIPGFRRPDLFNSVLTMKGGAYSPSKINAAVGVVSFVVWISLAIAHVFIASVGCRHLDELSFLRTLLSDPPTMLFAAAVVLLVFWVVAKGGLRSSFLWDHKKSPFVVFHETKAP